MPLSMTSTSILVNLVAVLSAQSVMGQVSCRGTPQFSSCSGHSQSRCGQLQGCDWGIYCRDSNGVYSHCCDGGMAPCDSLPNEKACYTQPGCSWYAPGQTVVTGVGPDGCFSADATVRVQNTNGHFTTKPMKDLQVGDSVLTNSETNTFQPVYAFGHNDPMGHLEFVELSFGKQQSIELSLDHMIYLYGRSAPVRADMVQIGDRLIQNGHPSEVTSISSLHKQGMYAPLTASGTIVVDGVLASTYVTLHKKSDTEEIKVNGMVLPFVNQNFAMHIAVAPLRMACTLTGSSLGVCKGEYDNLEGYNPYVAWGMEVIQWGEQQAAFVQVFLVYAAVVAFSLFGFLESVVMGPAFLAQLVWFLVSVAFVPQVLRGASKKSKMN